MDNHNKYIKNQSGLVVNTEPFENYLQQKKTIKALAASKNEISSIREEMNEIKQMLKILLDGKVND